MRTIRLPDLANELRRMQRLSEEQGVPGLEDYYRRVLTEGWVERNPDIYHLHEVNGRLQGFVGLLPVTDEAYRSFLSGRRVPIYDLRPEELLTQADYARAKRHGVRIWVESFAYRNADAKTAVGEFTYHYLSHLHLKGLVVFTSLPEDEANCRWFGLQELGTVDQALTGPRKLWYADETLVSPTPEEPFGPPTPIRSLFIEVRSRFGAASQLGLSEMERRVAELYYLGNCKKPRIGSLLGISEGTVHTYLDRIRAKAERVLGSRNSRPIAAWLEQHPSEIVIDRP